MIAGVVSGVLAGSMAGFVFGVMPGLEQTSEMARCHLAEDTA